jgi:hypothetical protein
MKITEKTFDVTTGEETITERDETAAEIKARLDREKEIAAKESAEAANATAKSALLEKLGISEAEAKLLLG